MEMKYGARHLFMVPSNQRETIHSPCLKSRKGQSIINAEPCLLHQAIDAIPPFLDTASAFSLGHPDFNYQNIFINDEGEITGIIDWDGIRALPRALGFARYPS
jgi:Ser/Thr protein kinase RdoA (MazF antagonist)